MADETIGDTYVSNGAWLTSAARPDTIDEVADQFERREGATAFWTELVLQRAARDARLAPRAARRAG